MNPVFRVPSESSIFAKRQSGFDRRKNLHMCLTCPAITARVTPAALKSVYKFRELA